MEHWWNETDRGKLNMEHWWNDTDRGKPKHSEKKTLFLCPSPISNRRIWNRTRESGVRSRQLKPNKKSGSYSYPMPPDFRKNIPFREAPRLRPFVLLVRVRCRYKRVLSIAEVILTGETEVLGKKNLSQCRFPHHRSHMK